MKRALTAIAVALAAAGAVSAGPGDLLAIRVGRAETISRGPIDHAVLLVADGVITTVGQDLEIERGIPILDRPDWVVMPGLVNAYSRAGMDSRGGNGSEPHVRASSELYARQDVWQDLLEAGITTLGLYPDGNGIPGQAVAVRPHGASASEMILRDDVYLLAFLRAQTSSKKMLRNGFEEADEYLEKEKKAREKYDKEVEKRKKRKKSKSKKDKDDDKDKGKDKDKEDEEPEPLPPYEPPAPDEEVEPFLALRDGSLRALFSIRKAADFLHLLDALGDEEIGWDLRIPLRRESDLFYVADEIREAGCRVVLEPRTTWQPTTRRDRNLPQELTEAGVEVVLVPRSDGITSQRTWLHDVGDVVKFGLDRDAALRAVTLAPAATLGLDARVGSLEAGKDANLLFFDGDPLEPTSDLKAVMLEGRFVAGEENL